MSSGKKEFDEVQKKAIEIDENAVVSAGAGSGKTTVLVERYARLVERRKLPVDSILALTFTRKAAAEMNSRIYARLATSENSAAKEQLDLFDTARIATLDSFCGTVARGAAHRYGIPPDFTVDEARLERVADEISVELLMDRKEDPAIRKLVATLGFDRVRRSLLATIASKHIGVAKSPTFAEDSARQAAELEKNLHAERKKLEAACAAVLDIQEDGGDQLEKAKNLIRGFLPLPVGVDEQSLSELARRAFILGGKEMPRPRIGANSKPGLIEFRELIEPIKETTPKVTTLCGSQQLRDDIKAIGVLLDDLARRFLARKRREGVLSFQDCAELATDILKTDHEIRAYYKKRLKSILIDEFQDNNELQKELLFLLAESENICSAGIPRAEDLSPDKLFFVGDEKQSIYRFRGADVSVFRKLSDELDRASGKSSELKLSFNHRSSAELVAFFNAVFPGVFGEALHDFEARFSAINTKKKLEGGGTAVEFHIADPAKAAGDSESQTMDKAEAEARAAARRIRSGVDSKEFTYGEVAVLFRSTTRQHEYERAFRAHGIPFQAADPRGLFADGPANDLYAAFRLCLFPQDRNAYAALLRSPFIRLGDESFARVMLDERRDPFPDDPPAAWFASGTDQRRFERGAELYRSLRKDADLMGISELVSRLWYDEGYRAALLSRQRSRTSLDHFEKLYALALDADKRRIPLTAFLDELTPLMGSSEKVEGDDASESSGNSVRLMTVHKSKGLEFPVVIVADAGNEGRGVRNDKPFYADREFGIVVNLRREDASRMDKIGNWFFDREKESETIKELAELRRLLYVAATRAERKLLFFGSRDSNKAFENALEGLTGIEKLGTFLKMKKMDSTGKSVDPKSFLDLIAEGLSSSEGTDAVYSVHEIDQKDSVLKMRYTAEPTNRQIPVSFYADARQEPRRERRRTATPTAIETAKNELEKNTVKKEQAAGLTIDPLLTDRQKETEFGTLCHLVIENALKSKDTAIIVPLAECALLFPEFAAEEQTAVAEAAVGLAKTFFDSSLGRDAAAAARRRSEFPFLISIESENPKKPFIINGKMDLIFEISGNPGRCVIIDFKTDKEINIAVHTAQMACYRKAAAAFSDFIPESWLFYLRGGIAEPIDVNVDLQRWTALSLDKQPAEIFDE